MKEFWNQRYQAEEYAYGLAPNILVKAFIDNLPPGKVLFPGEGEGRNAVYAAKKGWEVYAFDQSEAGAKKAINLATNNGVQIDYQVCDVGQYNFTIESFNLVVLCFFHLPQHLRQEFSERIYKSLVPQGKLYGVYYHNDQLKYSTGGPQSLDLLYDYNDMLADWNAFSEVTIEQLTMSLNEGQYHNGESSLITCEANK